MTTAFCKFRISKNLGIVEIDSDESVIRDYVRKVASEFKEGNAKLVSASVFDTDGGSTEAISAASSDEATFIQVMVTLQDEEVDDLSGSEGIITEKALGVLEANLQVTHSEERGNVSYVGFSQL